MRTGYTAPASPRGTRCLSARPLPAQQAQHAPVTGAAAGALAGTGLRVHAHPAACWVQHTQWIWHRVPTARQAAPYHVKPPRLRHVALQLEVPGPKCIGNIRSTASGDGERAQQRPVAERPQQRTACGRSSPRRTWHSTPGPSTRAVLLQRAACRAAKPPTCPPAAAARRTRAAPRCSPRWGQRGATQTGGSARGPACR